MPSRVEMLSSHVPAPLQAAYEVRVDAEDRVSPVTGGEVNLAGAVDPAGRVKTTAGE